MFIILHNQTNFNTSKPKNNANALHIFKSFYSRLINTIDFSSVECSCHSCDWSFHGYYKRYYTFLNRKIRVKILRIKCNTCGKTHALLIEDMIPFSTLSYEEIISGIGDDFTIDQSHHLYLLHKYERPHSFLKMCSMNTRKYTIHYIST